MSKKSYTGVSQRKNSALVVDDPPASGPKVLMELTEKQRHFAKAVSEGRNWAQAARMAGYATPEQAGKNLVRQPNVTAAIDYYQRQHEAAGAVTRKRVMDGFLRGIELAEIQGDAQNVIAGWRELGRMCGYYAPEVKKIDINMTAKRLVSRFEAMSDEDLVRMIDESAVVIENGEVVDPQADDISPSDY
jgi:phage terminase small subunit